MPSDPADQAFKTGHPRLWVAGLVLLALIAGALYLLRDGDPAIAPQAPDEQNGSVDAGAAREAAAVDFLFELSEALGSGTREEAIALAAPGGKAAARSLGYIFDNVNGLGIDDLSMRFVDENAGRVSGSAGSEAFVADVELAWRIGGFDEGISQMEVSMTLAESSGGAAFVSAAGDYGNRAPLWLLEDLAVRQSRNALVMVADQAEADRFLALADRAVVDVKKVLPRWRGKLVVEVPASQDQLNRTLAANDDAYDAIAAITTTVDGSLSPSSPTHIAVNPPVFGKLGGDGAQIVMSHEATHVATDAATSSMPVWLLEGFADYVALAHVDLPVSVTASQILRDIRNAGVPDALPGAGDFDPTNQDLGAVYESAWLACRYLADRYGERNLIAFYNAVERDSSVSKAFSRILNTNEQRFTRGWQGYLRELAS